jgi:hypothetical protein
MQRSSSTSRVLWPVSPKKAYGRSAPKKAYGTRSGVGALRSG